MAKKIKDIMTYHLRWYSEGKATLKELHSNYENLSDLVYKMWLEDLISDNVKKQCYEVLVDYSKQIFKLSVRENNKGV